jgi:hypothetical protein
MTSHEPDGRASRHLPLAGSLVREVLRRTPAELVEDDLYAAAVTALVAADTDFDPVHDAPYERYVTARVRESMYEALRSIDWSDYDETAAEARTAAARARTEAVLASFGDRERARTALCEETTPASPEAPELPYLGAALAELPPHPDGTSADEHLMQAESLAVLRASLLARQEEETRALAGLDQVAAAVRASRVSFAGGRVELTVVESIEHEDPSASTGRTA